MVGGSKSSPQAVESSQDQTPQILVISISLISKIRFHGPRSVMLIDQRLMEEHCFKKTISVRVLYTCFLFLKCAGVFVYSDQQIPVYQTTECNLRIMKSAVVFDLHTHSEHQLSRLLLIFLLRCSAL